MYVVDEAHVTTLAVHPDHQGRRIGARLLAALVRAALGEGMTSLTLEVRASNRPAQALYRRFGLGPAGIRRGYYRGSGEDAVVMWAEDIDSEAYGRRLDAIEEALAAEAPS
jgi:ribosomal-protein-alanine N-acetyltransferase